MIVGDEFLLNVYVSDVRPNPEGVYSAYLDVLFQNELVSALGSLTYGPSFGLSGDGVTTDPTLIDEGGAAALTLDPLGSGPFLLFTATLQANKAGQEVIVGDPAYICHCRELDLLFFIAEHSFEVIF